MKRQESEERRQKFEALVATGMSVAKAASAVGISTSTGFVWAQPFRRSAPKAKRKAVHFARLVPRAIVEKQVLLEIAGVVVSDARTLGLAYAVKARKRCTNARLTALEAENT